MSWNANQAALTGTLRERPEELQAKAAVLHEALPWIKRFAGRTAVVKYGGAAMSPPSSPSPQSSSPSGDGQEPAAGGADLDSFVDDVVLLRYVGVDVVVVHGGGHEISRATEQLGRRPVFVEGQRVTDAETMDLVRMILVGRINKTLVGRLNRHGRLAVGLSGEDGLLVTARPRRGPGGVDLGFVGDVEAVDPTALRALTAAGLIPVIATVGAGPDGQPYNINADAVAGAVAASLGAEKLVYLTDVEGLYGDLSDPGSLYSRITLAEGEELLSSGRLSSGIVPKLGGVVTALRAGVRSAHIVDGRRRHALLLELFTDQGIGTMIHSPEPGSPGHPPGAPRTPPDPPGHPSGVPEAARNGSKDLGT